MMKLVSTLIVSLIFGNLTDAIQVIKVGHQEFQLEGSTVELFDEDTSTSCVLSSSYFDHTSNKYGDAGVTEGKKSFKTLILTKFRAV